MNKIHLHFYGKYVSELKLIEQTLSNSKLFKTTYDYFDIKKKLENFNGANYVITSHNSFPGNPGKIKEITVGHGTGPFTLFTYNNDKKAYAKDLVRRFFGIGVPGQNFKQWHIQMGFPKDRILNIGLPLSIGFSDISNQEREIFLKQRNQDPSRQTVLYACTWNQMSPRGFFALWWKNNEYQLVEEFCSFVTEHLKMNLLIRFHERHRYAKDWLHSEYKDIFEKYNVHAIYFPEDPDETPYIKYCDFLVGDMSCTNTYFYVADKPVIHIGSDIMKNKRFQFKGIDVQDRNKAGFVVDEFENLLTKLEEVTQNPILFKKERKALVNKYIDFVGKASKQAIINEFKRVCK